MGKNIELIKISELKKDKKNSYGNIDNEDGIKYDFDEE
jgi:hypothetical protein